MLIPPYVTNNGNTIVWKFYVSRDIGPPCNITAVVNPIPGLTFQSITSSKGGVNYTSPNITWPAPFVHTEVAEVNMSFTVSNITLIPTTLTATLVFACDSSILNNTISETLVLGSILPLSGAVDDVACICGNVSLNDTPCNIGTTKYILAPSSLINCSSVVLDQDTGDYSVTIIDFTLPYSFEYDIWCDIPGTGLVQSSGPALVSGPPLLSSWLSAPKIVKEDFTGISGATAFALSNTPLLGYDVFVYRNGVEQPFTEYSVVGNVVTLVTPMAASGGASFSETLSVHYYI